MELVNSIQEVAVAVVNTVGNTAGSLVGVGLSVVHCGATAVNTVLGVFGHVIR